MYKITGRHENDFMARMARTARGGRGGGGRVPVVAVRDAEWPRRGLRRKVELRAAVGVPHHGEKVRSESEEVRLSVGRVQAPDRDSQSNRWAKTVA
jgi:hypothetical protein